MKCWFRLVLCLLRSTLGACFAYFSREKLSNLTDEERCARISRILIKKDIAQSLLDTFNATTFGHALDENDHVKLKTLGQDLINAFESVNLKRNASHITTVNDDNADGFSKPPKKVNC
ncbi:hypothetical protein CEXT_714471 [Caerostris extrusa]|uniref:Uncharacterized protein n=1 Tax=Caerostris extrusa TaxID=172846 RepID=A0AAV4YE63_CAEEX|nr:hypothetical protein CEXT_714471 [Caerostris extrusa]